MLEHLVEWQAGAVTLVPVRKSGLESWRQTQPEAGRAWMEANNFTAEPGQVLVMPHPEGHAAAILVGLSDDDDPWAFAGVVAKLPLGTYAIAGALPPRQADWAALSWALATYAFGRYKSRGGRDWPKLVWPEHADRDWVTNTARATALVRDLINTPAADLGPAELATAAEVLAADHGARVRVVVGDGLIAENYPAIHAVGRAAGAQRQPRLIDLTWGQEDAPKLTLVGKGVCFDSGGLDLKSSANMKLMKKDMGGAAHVLGLALMVMAAKLPLRLRVLIPAVENAVSAEAMRPGDVLPTRKGLSIEVGNTDAEGRLILCDALAEAARENPALLIDMATLTGAARTALGTEIAALFCNDDTLAADIAQAGEALADPVWRLPLHRPYRRLLDSKVADLNNISDGPYAGAITAALFLAEFVGPAIPWAHFDIMAWNTTSRPGRPDGGEAMALRALYSVIVKRFGTNP
ncbi:leucyl aminopeptidase family protein [Magnetospirillum gryphiswaldense]|uniref:Leucine aminopeptidase n=1 Tax=Magnetospirillum gryphiswaldense TaxID=55518 RepID=A4U225_9PROT|nr:leucyl aminopeptidase family protein [Magnetospirillum gryphiswaldense]AVM74893.1 Peptidase B [Magnetospirillum gryphiswaldense MSR-1]AVM78796.1 Peptidase B [Magnetospirillum gryphiswaldense]CAM76932.1 leucine aminopeptidase [Magnetospirillum gryphiswaldense MSR-1]